MTKPNKRVGHWGCRVNGVNYSFPTKKHVDRWINLNKYLEQGKISNLRESEFDGFEFEYEILGKNHAETLFDDYEYFIKDLRVEHPDVVFIKLTRPARGFVENVIES